MAAVVREQLQHLQTGGKSFWRKDPPVLNDDNSVRVGGMWQYQLDWWNLPNFIKALITGYGGGKTFMGGKRSIAVALHNSPAPHLVVSPSYKMAKRTTIPTIQALLDGRRSLDKSLWYKFHKTDHEFQIRYRGRDAIIWVASGDDPQSLKGPNIGSALIDEPFIQEEEVFTQTMARIRHPAARLKELALTGTPESLNWGYDICEGDRREDFDLGIIRASTRANLALEQSYSDRLESALTDIAAQAYLEGMFINLTTGRVYYGFSDENIVRLDVPPQAKWGVGMDFNVNPMAFCVFWYYGDHMHIFREHELPNADTEYACQFIKDNYIGPNGKCIVKDIFPDSTGNKRATNSPGGKTDFWYIKDAGFEIQKVTNPLVRDRENSVNGKLAPRHSRPTLTVDPNCKKLISYFNKYTHEEKLKQKNMSHLCDSVGYPVHKLYPVHELITRADITGH